MARTELLGRYAGRELTRRVSHSFPGIGSVMALMALGSTIRRKGLLRGVIHFTLDAIPFVGSAKNVAELARGCDFIPDIDPLATGSAHTIVQ